MKNELLVIARDLREAIKHDLRGAAMDWAARRLEALAQSPTKEESIMATTPNAPRIGSWMQTASGKKFWPLDPRPEDIDINDIAAALSKQCRFGGHCEFHYSVAQHSIYVSHQVPPEHQLGALMHDATEAYCIDVPRPLKRSLVGYDKVEARIWMAIATKFALPLRLPSCIHEADEAVLMAEKAQVMRPGEDWTYRYDVSPANIKIAQWTAEQAAAAFLSRFEVLVLQQSYLRNEARVLARPAAAGA